jgi:NDP-sugar pyrophosphorylase family protein
MEYNLSHAVHAGFDRVIFVIRPELTEVLQRQVLPRLPDGLQYEIVLQTLNNLPAGCSVPAERSRPLGTAHALWCCNKLLTENFAVINADDYYGAQAFELLLTKAKETETETENNHAMVAYQLQNTLSKFGSVNRGLCQLSKENNLEYIEECENIIEQDGIIRGNLGVNGKLVELDKDTLISMNCWLFNTDIFPLLTEEIRHILQGKKITTECYLPNVVMKQIVQQQKKVIVLKTTEHWFGLTHQQDCQSVSEKTDAIST